MAPHAQVVDAKCFIKQVGDSEAGIAGPIYRSIYVEDDFSPLPEGMHTTWDIFTSSVKRFPNNRMLGHRKMVDGVAKEYEWLTYQQVYEYVIQIGAGIRAVGVQPKDKCGVYGANCPEWLMAMEACNGHSMLCVPLYDTLGSDAVEFIINHAEVSIAFVQNTKLDLLIASLPKCSNLKTLVSFAGYTDAQKAATDAAGVAIYSWTDFLKLGKDNPVDVTPPRGADMSTIMYTSGTTGEPKGVLIGHENILAAVAGLDHFLKSRVPFGLEPLSEKDVYYSFLPLAHIFDRVSEEFFLFLGASIGFWQGDVKKITEDLAELKPTVFVAVPRVFDRIHGGISGRITAAGGIRKFLFDFGYNRKLGAIKSGAKHDKAAPFFDKLVFNKVKMGLGGNVKIVLSGAAPLAAHVEEFLRVVTCAPVVQGYGLTESCAASFIQIPNVISMAGTVGPPLPNIDCRLVSVPELNYDAFGTPARGEIQLRGKTLFSGYYKRQDLTDEVFQNGWFSTGDIGEWQENGALKIIDRKKNIFKLSQGEYVAVENLENIYGQCDAVDQIWVYGNSFESTLIAVCVPNEAALTEWAKTNGVVGDFAQICKDPKAEAYIMAAVNATGKAKKVKGFEAIRGVILEPLPFDVERNLITPTFKLKRPQLLAHYKERIDALYAGQQKR